MSVVDLPARARLLQADLRTAKRAAQSLGSGATIHTVVNEFSAASAALQRFYDRQDCATAEHLASLLDLADASLHALRARVAQAHRS